MLSADDLEDSIHSLAIEITENISLEGKPRIAFVDFLALGNRQTALGQHIAEALVTETFIVAPDKVEIVERRHLDKIIREQKLSANDLFDSKTLEKVGKLIGADYLVSGTISDIGDQVEFNLRVFSVETSTVISGARQKSRKQGTVQVLLDRPITHQAATEDDQSNAVNNAIIARDIGNPLTLELKSATRKGKKLVVDALLIANESDINVVIRSNYGAQFCRIITENGTEYRPEHSQMGSDIFDRYQQYPFVKGIPISFKMNFVVNDDKINKLLLVEVDLDNENHLQLRNIPVIND